MSHSKQTPKVPKSTKRPEPPPEPLDDDDEPGFVYPSIPTLADIIESERKGEL